MNQPDVIEHIVLGEPTAGIRCHVRHVSGWHGPGPTRFVAPATAGVADVFGTVPVPAEM
jgi:hypothetical protein